MFGFKEDKSDASGSDLNWIGSFFCNNVCGVYTSTGSMLGSAETSQSVSFFPIYIKINHTIVYFLQA